jgi:hypothetical protein
MSQRRLIREAAEFDLERVTPATPTVVRPRSDGPSVVSSHGSDKIVLEIPPSLTVPAARLHLQQARRRVSLSAHIVM